MFIRRLNKTLTVKFRILKLTYINVKVIILNNFTEHTSDFIDNYAHRYSMRYRKINDN